jgi:sodium/potassium/calcium exchanger 6
VGARVETCKPRAVAKAKRCHYVRHNPACSKDENIVPYLTIHYCHMRRLATLSTALQLSLAVFFISVMAIVAERFFVPSLENVSRALRLPEDVAGATARSVHWSPYDRVGVVNADP